MLRCRYLPIHRHVDPDEHNRFFVLFEMACQAGTKVE
jgi:hypothetical protein